MAAISIVAYNNIQQKARDSQRKQDVAITQKGLELFYSEKGFYPNATTYTPGSTAINPAWATTADASWTNLEAQLSPYISRLSKDPISSSGSDVRGVVDSCNYDIFVNQSTYCGVARGQAYIISYKLEASAQEDVLTGTCSDPVIGPWSITSDVRMVK